VGLSASSIKGLLKDVFLKIAWRLIKKKPRTGNRIPVLCYHRVLPALSEAEPYQIWSILPEQFETQLTLLRDEGFTTLSLTEFERMARGLSPVQERAVLLTFDDGFADNYEIAWNIAQKFNAKINLFICPEYVGLPHPVFMRPNGYEAADAALLGINSESVRRHLKKFPHLWKPLTWRELREMQDAGVQIGLHSQNHRNLARLTPQELVTDTSIGLAVMEQELGQRPRYFALPYGCYEHYTPQVIATLMSLGLELIFAAHAGLARLPSRQSLFPRILITQQDNRDTFRQKICGVYDWWEEISRITNNFKEVCKILA
jgi:peptidoglycan/xylan/chitin deacetylase (PgdA/CDA1 family)